MAEKIVYRFVRKHMAGPTMKSAIDTVKALNKKGIPASVSFLSETPATKAKCNYITTVYMQLAREIARQALRANIHLTLEQLGSGVDMNLALHNLSRVIDTCNSKGVFLWCGVDSNAGVLERIQKNKGVGFAFENIDDAIVYSRRKKANMLKATCRYMDENKKHDMAKEIGSAMRAVKNFMLLSPSDGIVKAMMRDNRYRKSLIFEFQLGYSEKKIKKLAKRGARISMYVPFGRNWIGYVMGNMPDGHIMHIVRGTLKEREVEEKEERIG